MTNAPLPATTDDDRNWAGDMLQPHGDVTQECPHCGLPYKGLARRTSCRACNKLKIYFPSLFIKK